MNTEVPCFTRFTGSVKEYDLPKRFTFPFYYQPHPLCILAAKQLQNYLINQQEWQHNFGLSDDPYNIIGKMFGVLLVKNAQGELGFLAAFSGKLAEQNHIKGFVPPVFDLLADNSFFLAEQVAINQLNQQIQQLQKSPTLLACKKEIEVLETEQAKQLSMLRAELVENRKTRKKKRQNLDENVDKTKRESAFNELAQQSVYDKWRLKEFTEHSQQLIGKTQEKLQGFTQQIVELKSQRKILSADLQNRIFNQYQFLNKNLEPKGLVEIFAQTALKTPPAGAGECAAPKLLQYAFKHQLQPLAMAEFWWGASPKSEVKQHQQYYPACMGKCQPILTHMLEGMQLDENPLANSHGEGKNVEVIYQDEDILIVNKPTEFLSVPGKDITDSVFQRIKQQYPQATGPIIVHRLDMSTSGLMVIALNPQANKYLQKQFIQRQVQKQYVALVEGLPIEDQGELNLPLIGDFYDRPKQIVCHKDGKPAKTYWQVLKRYPEKNQSRLLLTPHTGRTHQLRVHCAHAQGLNMPIVGDDLYGKRDSRLHLHAQRLTITHPTSEKLMTFEVEATF